MALSFGLEQGVGFVPPPIGTEEIANRLRKGENVIVGLGSIDDEYLSESEIELPDSGRLIFKLDPEPIPAQTIDIVDFSGDSVPLSQAAAA